MKTAECMKRLYDHVRRINKERIGWIAIWITVWFIMPISGFEHGIETGLYFLICSGALLFAASWEYADKFLEIGRAEGATEGPALSLGLLGSTGRFVNIMRLHAFDSNAYFRILIRRLFPWQALTIAYAAVLGIVRLIEGKVSLCLVLAAALIPVLTLLMRAGGFRHALMHESRRMAALGGVIRFAYRLAVFILYETVLLSLVLLALALIGSSLAMRGIDEKQVAMVSVGSGNAFLFCILGAVVFGYVVLDTVKGGKKRRILNRGLIAAALLGVAAGIGIYAHQSVNDILVIHEDGITVKRGGTETEYGLGDVASYRVFPEENDSLQMELAFSDGSREKLFLDSSETTPAWEERYQNRYDYAAELSEKLAALGVKGTVEDRDTLAGCVEDASGNGRKALERIIASTEAEVTEREEQGILNAPEDIGLRDTDGNGSNYAFTYDGEVFSAVFTPDNWKVVDSWKIGNAEDIRIICRALINEHPVHGSDMVSYRSEEDMAYEWMQHNIAYGVLPEGHPYKDNAKDVDLDPADQNRSFAEIYEDRTGKEFNLKNFTE
ncbi:MAG: hypothetical protein K6E50_04725 [Lachnospiraceae bacterium]|nr:hypothetical protein [Lachnospiraceae bacterium]